MQKVSQTTCAYCGLDFTKSFRRWLQMALDHVVPKEVCKKLCVQERWVEDYTNRVLACGACNGFDNQYKPPAGTKCPRSLKDFYRVRDQIFQARKAQIAERRRKELAIFRQRPWEQGSYAATQAPA
jgi:hypothetical protein